MGLPEAFLSSINNRHGENDSGPAWGNKLRDPALPPSLPSLCCVCPAPRCVRKCKEKARMDGREEGGMAGRGGHRKDERTIGRKEWPTKTHDDFLSTFSRAGSWFNTQLFVLVLAWKMDWLEVWLEIPYTKKMEKNEYFTNVSSHFSSKNSS